MTHSMAIVNMLTSGNH